MGKLTTHVLDTATGKPAEGLKIELHSLAGSGRKLIGNFITNHDGRVDAPLLEGGAFQPGRYELTFFAGAYLDQSGAVTTAPKFLDEIPIRFGLAEDKHYHVPLLLAAHGYSTYRGS